ncbi:MAG: TetR/AcrR family transcriptional regulator [Leptospiraceae bacterium]|nr:TetR/AcrR family transcriptional regulator [Leptospiraceae bacterium]MDW8307381.1 TetR/AcrR family transcriptional regulator [Leptospiraceae bacterium]
MGRKALDKPRILNPDVRQDFIQRLIPFFMERGFSNTKMEDIARYLGVSKATLYEHFSSQEELYSLAVDYVLQEIRASRSILEKKELSYAERYVYLFAVVLQQVAGITPLFVQDIEENYPQLWQRVQDFYQSWEKDLQNFYEEGRAAGTFIEIHPAVFSRTIIAMLKEMINSEFLITHALTLPQLLLDFFKIHSQGVFQKTEKIWDLEKLALSLLQKIFSQEGSS